MKIGIPRAMLYFKNGKFWTTLFDELKIEYILSPETNKEIIDRGSKLAIDEACLPEKVMLGHVEWLIGKCDYIFIPRIEYCEGYEMCTRFLSLPDLIVNTFREKSPKILFYNITKNSRKGEYKAIKKMCKFLGIKRRKAKEAYIVAKQTQGYFEMFRAENQENLLSSSHKNKVLIVAHAYNIGDKYIGGNVLRILKELDCDAIIAEYANAQKCINLSKSIAKTLPWTYNKHLVGAIELYKDRVDGIILLTTFPCGTDSMVNEMVVRKYKDIPIVVLTLDSQDGSAGIETRLESFVDIMNFKKGEM